MFLCCGDAKWSSWLRQFATTRTIAGSIYHGGQWGFFLFINLLDPEIFFFSFNTPCI